VHPARARLGSKRCKAGTGAALSPPILHGQPVQAEKREEKATQRPPGDHPAGSDMSGEHCLFTSEETPRKPRFAGSGGECLRYLSKRSRTIFRQYNPVERKIFLLERTQLLS